MRPQRAIPSSPEHASSDVHHHSLVAMVQRSRSMPGDTQRRTRRKDAFVLTLLALLAIGLWLLATSHDTPTQTRIVTTIFRAQVLRDVDDGEDHSTGLDLVRTDGERFSRKHSEDIVTRLRTSSKWMSMSSSYADASPYTRTAARAWEHLLQEGVSGAVGNIGLEDRRGQHSETRRSGNFAHRFQKRFSADVLQAVGESVQSGRTLGVQPADEQQSRLLAEFDWQTYLLYYPDLKEAGIDTEGKARQHYLAWGRAEGRVHKRLRVILRYTACTGLINQHYSHIAAFVLSYALHSEIVLPPAAQRDSFGKYFSTRKDENEISWTPVPLNSLLDVGKVTETWRIRGMTVHEVHSPSFCLLTIAIQMNTSRKLLSLAETSSVSCQTPALLPFPDLTEPQTAYPLYNQEGLNERLIVRLDNVYLQVKCPLVDCT